MSEHSSVGRSHCQNCGTALTGPYCSACGQHDVDYHRSLWPILEDSLEGILHFDGKFFRTVRWLFTRPGFLTKEFIAGKRVSYTQPLRLYIFASFLYFASGLAFNTSNPGPAKFSFEEGAPEKKEAVQKATVPQNAAKPAPQAASGALLDRLQKEDPKDLTAEIRHLAPTMAFFCIPFLALLLSAPYAKSGRVYVEHLIFALHVQALIFVCALVTGGFEALARLVSVQVAQLIGFLAFLGGWWLIFHAFREVYGEGRWKTIFKMAAIGVAYGVVLLTGIVLMAIAAAILVMN